MLAALVLAGLVLGEVRSAETPRVALMFASRGPMPLENVWKQFLGSVRGVRPPALSAEQWREVMQEDKVAEVERRIRSVGQFAPNTIVSNKSCVFDSDISESAAALADSWHKTPKGPLPSRGAKLLDPSVPPHPIYEAQELFSLYVHVPPEFEGYTPDSVFYGREITPSTHGERFRHTLGKLSLYLLEAALNDPQVHNARFVMISEADAPLYNAAVTYLELMTSPKSRVGPSRQFEELLQQDPEFSTLSPMMFVAPFTKNYFSKTTQWVSVSRAAAFAVVHDRIVEPWFATFAGSRWRCRFISEASLILPDVAAMIKTGIDIRKRAAAMVLLKYRALPPGFTQGEYFERSLPETRVSFPGGGGIEGHSMSGFFLNMVGIPSWASELWHSFFMWIGGAFNVDGLTAAQRSAMDSYRKHLRYKVPAWAYIPVNVPKWEAGRERRRGEEEERAQRVSSEGGLEQVGSVMISGRSQDSIQRTPSLLASGIGPIYQAGESSTEVRRKRGQIWEIVLDADTPRSSVAMQRKLREDSQGFDAAYEVNGYEDQILLAHSTLQAWPGEASDDTGTDAVSLENVGCKGELARDSECCEQRRLKRGCSEGGVVNRCNKFAGLADDLCDDAVTGQLEEENSTQRRRLQGNGQEHPEARNETIHKLLNSREPVDSAVDKPYNLEWPFPSCVMCKVNPWSTPYDLWNRDQQMAFLRFIFPGSASRVVNIVSDECMVKSLLNFYNVNGEKWQTDGFSSHVDWTRANNGGHPGDYTQLMLQTDADYIRQVVREMRCDQHANRSYESAFQLFEAGAATQDVTQGSTLAEAWQYSPLDETCVLFARKFLPDTNAEVDTFFTDCRQLGLGSDCLKVVAQQSLQEVAPNRAPNSAHNFSSGDQTQRLDLTES